MQDRLEYNLSFVLISIITYAIVAVLKPRGGLPYATDGDARRLA